MLYLIVLLCCGSPKKKKQQKLKDDSSTYFVSSNDRPGSLVMCCLLTIALWTYCVYWLMWTVRSTDCNYYLKNIYAFMTDYIKMNRNQATRMKKRSEWSKFVDHPFLLDQQETICSKLNCTILISHAMGSPGDC